MLPDTPEALLRKGQALLAEGKAAQAQEILHNAGKICTHGPSLLEIGHALHSVGDTYGALATYRSAFGHDNSLSDAAERVASLLMTMGGSPAAISFLTPALESSPQVALLHQRMAEALEANDQVSEAFAEAKIASLLDSNSEEIALLRNRLQAGIGAKAVLEEVDPTEPEPPGHEFEGTATLQVPNAAIPKRADLATNASAMTSDLTEFRLPELLGLLVARRATGRMEVYSDKKSAVIGLQKGCIVFANHSDADDFHTFLTKTSTIPPVSMDALEVTATDSDAHIATRVEKYGLLETDELVELIKNRIGQSLKTMMTWTSGYSSFLSSGDESLGNTFGVEVDTQWAVFEAFKHLDENE